MRKRHDCARSGTRPRVERRFPLRRLESVKRVAALLVILLVTACSSSRHVSRPTHSPPITSAPASTPRACRSSDLHLAIDPGGVSEATGQNTIVFRLVNRSSSPCRLTGYPTVRLLATNGHAFPFKFVTSGDMMLTTAKPAPVALAPGGTAFGAVNRFRCERQENGRVTRMDVEPPGDTGTLATGLGYWATVAYFGYCGPGDFGSQVDVAPIVAALPQLLRSVAG